MSYGKSHWIKLYVEMLDDPKVGLLPDAIKWRWCSVLLLAGEMDEDGFLPDVNDMAWRLHTNVETLQGEMRMLAGRGLVELRLYSDGSERWFIPAFGRRQAPASSTERSRASRHRARNSNDDATNMQRNVAKTSHKQKQNTEAEAEAEGEKSGADAPARPAPSPPYQPVPKAVQQSKARRGRADPEPAIVATAPPAIRLLAEITGYWPGADVTPALVDRLGDAPQEVALGRAVELWRMSGNKPTNWLGITDWYEELCRDPDWTPQKRFKPNAAAPAGAALSPSEQAAADYARMKREITGGR